MPILFIIHIVSKTKCLWDGISNCGDFGNLISTVAGLLRMDRPISDGVTRVASAEHAQTLNVAFSRRPSAVEICGNKLHREKPTKRSNLSTLAWTIYKIKSTLQDKKGPPIRVRRHHYRYYHSTGGVYKPLFVPITTNLRLAPTVRNNIAQLHKLNFN